MTVDDVLAAMLLTSDTAAVDAVYTYCLDAAERDAFEEIASLLAAVCPEKLSVVVMLAPLAVTVPYGMLVPGRSEYFARVRAELEHRQTHGRFAGLPLFSLLVGLE